LRNANFSIDTLIFVDIERVMHVTLYDKRADYRFHVNRFLDIDSNVSKAQSISTFYGKIVRLFGINTHPLGFFENVSHVAAYLISQKRYLFAFYRFLKTQKGNPRLFGSQRKLELLYDYLLQKRIEQLNLSV
jgi:hypothetical protein